MSRPLFSCSTRWCSHFLQLDISISFPICFEIRLIWNLSFFTWYFFTKWNLYPKWSSDERPITLPLVSTHTSLFRGGLSGCLSFPLIMTCYVLFCFRWTNHLCLLHSNQYFRTDILSTCNSRINNTQIRALLYKKIFIIRERSQWIRHIPNEKALQSLHDRFHFDI